MKNDTGTRMRAGLGRKFPIPCVYIPTLGAFLLNLILEMLSRMSVGETFAFIFKNPAAFALSWAIVAFTLSIALMFRKKVFSVTLTTVLWLAAGIANAIILFRRTGSPLSAVDLQLNMEAILMLPVYYDWWQVILGGLVIIGVLTGLVLLAVKTQKYRKETKKSVMRLIISLLALGLCAFYAIGGKCVSTSLRPSLYDAYRDYGFAYCFAYSFFDTGIKQPETYSVEEVKNIGTDIEVNVDVDESETEEDKTFIEDFREFVRNGLFESSPEGYTAEAVDAIRNALSTGSTPEETENMPNIIFVQLEAFFDPKILTSYEVDGDPIPNFRRLMSEYTSGELYMPTVSGGTANSEFEVLTGCDLDFFGSGEFPFYTVLKDDVCESLAADLGILGLNSTFIHNYTGSFYYRNTVYSNLCFDRFVSIEYMDGYDVTPKGWAKDSVLEKYIMQSLTSTEGRDFVFTVTVQTHGSYVAPEGFESKFTVTKAPGETQKADMEYYVTQLSEADAFIGSLVNTLSNFDEDTMVVFYGDHLPGLNFEVEDLSNGNLYATNYVIWANFDIEKQDRDLEAYQLGAYALKLLGLEPGIMVRYHQSRMDSADYMDGLKIMEYDIMYGEHYVYGGRELKRDNEMQFGIDEIKITSVETRENALIINGEGFTAASKVYIDEDEKETIRINANMLVVPGEELNEESTLSVCQVCADGVILSSVTSEGEHE